MKVVYNLQYSTASLYLLPISRRIWEWSVVSSPVERPQVIESSVFKGLRNLKVAGEWSFEFKLLTMVIERFCSFVPLYYVAINVLKNESVLLPYF